MLLPSALPCDAFSRPSSLHPSSILSPPLTPTVSPQTTTNNIHATCLALQSLLANSTSASLATPPRASQPDLPSPRPLLQSPIVITSAAATSLAHDSSRGSRKRRRSSVGESSRTRSRPSTPTSSPNNSLFPSTPKRRCLCPPSLPPGLERADFVALHPSPPPNPLSSRPVPPARKTLKPMTLRRKLVPPSSSSFPSCNSISPLLPPSPPSPSAETIPSLPSPPSPTNHTDNNLDPLLIALVLQKLRLRQRNGAASSPARRIDW